MPHSLLTAHGVAWHSTSRRSPVRSLLAALSAVGLILGLTVVVAPAAVAATPCTNEIACENLLPGTPQSQWDIVGAGDASIQGFATQMSVNRGSTVQFKIKTDASSYTIQIFRLGYYQGNGARKIADVTPSGPLPRVQPNCMSNAATEIFDCGNWSVSASWAVPSTAVSGVYIARLFRADKNDVSQIPFIVRNDASTSQVVFQTSDSTWQAYNAYGGSDFYRGLANGRAYKLSYNRPFATRDGGTSRDYLFSNEYPMIRFLESNGYDMSYISSLDTDQSGLNLNGNATNIQNHKVFLSVGHDEYWSEKQRTNVENARNAGVNLAFFSGNEVYWKTRWEPSQDGTNTANRTLVCYKDTWANAVIDPAPAPAGPTATWRDPRFGSNGHGPENALTGTAYVANNSDLPITVNAEEGKLRLWRGTSLATQAAGTSTALAPHTVGYESDEDLDNGYRPAGLIRMSTTTGAVTQYLQDFGNTTAPGTTTHHLTMYKAPSGALVFGAGTVQWAWGLDVNHDGVVAPVDTRMQQATVNILADMGATATTLSTPGVVPATKSTDTVAPTAVITAPAGGGTIGQGSTVTVTGTATDADGVVAGVEVSLDGGTTWHPATGRASFTYTGVVTATGSSAIQARAIDDSGNIQLPATILPLTVNCPCSIFGSAVPATPAASDSSAVTLGVKFTTSANGFITGLRFYKGAGNSGTHTGTLYKADGTVLSTVTFTNETPTGWQTASFPSAVAISTGTTYVASYVAPTGRYSADSQYFASMGKTSGVLTALGSSSNTNGVYTTGSGMPSNSYQQTNYYVDVIYSRTDSTPLTAVSTTPTSGATSVPATSPITATFSRDPDGGSVTLTVKDSAGNAVAGTTSPVSAQRVVTFTPSTTLAAGGTYTATLNAKAGGVPMAPAATWTFTTVKPDSIAGVCPCSLFNDSDAPVVAAENDLNSVELGVAFTADTTGVVTGVKFYKGPGNTGTNTISLWSSTGTRLATATVSAESTTGWQTATFATPVNVTASTTYIASYRAPVGRYSDTANGLSAVRDRAPLHTPTNAGRYTYGAGAPLSTSSANYFVDPVFTVAAGAAPTVSVVAPANQATSVPVSTKVTVTFSTQVQPGSASVTLKDANGVNVPGAPGNEPLGPTASFTPTASLAAAQTYTVTVTGAKNLGGTPMAAPFTSTFKTAGASVCPCSLLASTATPPVSDSGDASPISVGLRFTTSIDGFITGLRYYRDAANTGTHTGALYNAAGTTKLALLTFPTTAPGWQTANFASPVAVTAGTTYVASAFMPVGHYSVASNFFAAPVVNTPLTGTLGTYTYGSDTFPASSWNNSYYFVDVAFSPQDTAPPVVTSTSPDGSAPVQPDASVSATFGRPITNDATLVMTVKDAVGTAVAGTVSYATATNTATFQPTSALTQGVTYTASIQAKSASGVSMPAATVWTFSTVAVSPPGTTSSLYADTDTPVNAAWNDNGPITVGIKFSPAQSGSVTAVKFYAGAGNNGPYTVDLWAADGTKLGTGVATGNATVNKWKTVILNSPVAVTGGATYTASYRGSSGHYAVTSGGLAGGKTTGPLQIPANGAVYSYPAGFPSSATGTDFAVDVVAVLNAAVPPPPVAPTVTATSPGAALAQPDALVTATFDQDIQANTLVMSLKNGSTSSIPGVATYDSSSKTATFTPSAALPFGATLTASAKATSAAGASMATATTWTFTTVATPQQGTASSVFAPTTIPATAAYADNGPVSVGMKFSSDQAGFVTAIKFYVGTGNTGPWTVDLWDSTGIRVGGGQATGAASGWKTVVLDASVAVQAGATYTASYRGATGHYSVTGGGLSAAKDIAPLHTPVNAGVYSYPAAFPAASTGTDFAVDVVLVVPVAPVAPAAAALQQTAATEPPASPTVTSQATVQTTPTDPPTTSASSSAASSTTTPTP